MKKTKEEILNKKQLFTYSTEVGFANGVSYEEAIDAMEEAEKQSSKELIDLEERRFKWSSKIFPNATSFSSLQKLKKEVEEIEKDLENKVRKPSEYADVLMCLFDSARRQEQPITPQEIIDAFREKLEINFRRDWIDNGDGTYSHKKKEYTCNADCPDVNHGNCCHPSNCQKKEKI